MVTILVTCHTIPLIINDLQLDKRSVIFRLPSLNCRNLSRSAALRAAFCQPQDYIWPAIHHPDGYYRSSGFGHASAVILEG
jgi:hypothetical protein